MATDRITRFPSDGEELTDADLDAVSGGCGRSKPVSRARQVPGGGGSTSQTSSNPEYECQLHGGGNQGTFNEIDTELSVF
jgi:hypothetical protein